MESLFNSKDANAYIERINKLKPTDKPLWGKMNSAQMLAHCAAPLKMAHGADGSKRGLFSLLFGKMFKNKMVKPGITYSRNLPTDPKFIFPNAADFEKEKQSLISEIKNFSEKGPDAITNRPHSFFGKMTPKEWDILQCKHLEHHLSQFGA